MIFMTLCVISLLYKNQKQVKSTFQFLWEYVCKWCYTEAIGDDLISDDLINNDFLFFSLWVVYKAIFITHHL